ncbi:putative E3 ubiquitin-protein ligase RNF144A-B [Senna tora]|uniref:Putative E3 ubiquitin-protein ligase RNF144A-B n=1 Tax=Senna tora TaxID=362788 RepID=A0A834WN15_9FABA|nr:putative E3 ubiquitin-protein ligase RNF144A-B [Senna tora]
MENAGSTHHHRCRSVCVSALHSSTHRHLGSISAMVKIDFVALSHWYFFHHLVILADQKFYCPYKDHCSVLLIDDEGGVIKESESPNCKRWFCAQCKLAQNKGCRGVLSANSTLRNQLVVSCMYMKCRSLKTINSKKFGVDLVCFTSHPTTIVYSSKNGWDELLGCIQHSPSHVQLVSAISKSKLNHSGIHVDPHSPFLLTETNENGDSNSSTCGTSTLGTRKLEELEQ